MYGGVLKLLRPSHLEVWRLAKPYLIKARAYRHSIDALRFALKLLRIEGGDPDVVIPTAILHDIGFSKTRIKWTQTTSGSLIPKHMEEGAKIAEEILNEASYPKDKAREVVDIIRVHDLKPLPLQTLNAMVFKDADKLAGYYTMNGLRAYAKLRNKAISDVLSELEEAMDSLITETGRQIAKNQVRKLKRRLGRGTT